MAYRAPHLASAPQLALPPLPCAGLAKNHLCATRLRLAMPNPTLRHLRRVPQVSQA